MVLELSKKSAKFYFIMQEISNLFDFYNNCTSHSLSVVYYDTKNPLSLNYNQIRCQIYEVTEFLVSECIDNSAIGCLIRPNVTLPSVILGIINTSRPFVFLNTLKPDASLKSLMKYVQITTLLVEEILLMELKTQLCSCWLRKEKTVLHNVSPLVLLQASKCSNDMCPNSKMEDTILSRNHPELAYIIQTSGTTGEPKIVQVPQQCIVPNIIDLKCRFNVKAVDVLLLCSPLSFDPSIIEIFLSISSGCKLVIVPDQLKAIPEKLTEVIAHSKVTILQCTPSLFQSFGHEFIKNTLLSRHSNLKVLAFGGEPCPSITKLKRWRSIGNKTKFFNLYGLTENSCWASCYEIDFDIKDYLEIPLGDPLLGTDIEVSSEGELYIGGDKRWCLINDEVWPDPDKRHMRATGDFVTESSTGLLYFNGRKDSIIKYKGQKLSLHQISAVLDEDQDISNHYVHFDAESSKLIVFVVCNAGTVLENSHKLVCKLSKSVTNLPVTEVIDVAYMPINKHGKADCEKLLELARMRNQGKRITENTNNYNYLKVVSDLWKDYTGQFDIAEDDNFVLKGGDSIKALRYASDIELKLQISIPMLVDTILNCSFKDVVQTVEGELKFKQKPKSNSTIYINNDVSCQPPPKKMCNENFRCYEVSSRRGYSLMCCHSMDNACGGVINRNETFVNAGLCLELSSKFDLKKCIDASPYAVHFFGSDQTLVFIGSHSGIFCCVNTKTKELEWTITLADRIESSACLSVCGNFVFVGCYDTHLYCLDVQKGSVRWKLKTNAEVKSSPVVSSQNVVFVGSHDRHLYSVNAESGLIIWKKQISKGSIFSSPVLSEKIGAVAIATLDGVVAVLKIDTGTVMWTYEYDKPMFSSPLLTSTALFIGSTNNCLLKFDLSGTMIFAFETNGPIFSSPVITSLDTELILFGCHDSCVYCIDTSGELVWKFLCDSGVYATPFVFQWMQCKYVSVASTAGIVYILNLADGKVKHSWKCPGEIFSSPIILNDLLIIGCRDNYVYSFNLSGVT